MKTLAKINKLLYYDTETDTYYAPVLCICTQNNWMGIEDMQKGTLSLYCKKCGHIYSSKLRYPDAKTELL